MDTDQKTSKLHLIVIIALMADFMLPKTVNAKELELSKIVDNHAPNYQSHILMAEKYLGPVLPYNKKDELKLQKPKRITKTVITAYSSTVDQTDASPCITANGFNVCQNNQENIVAANFLPFGAKIKIPELFGDKIFTVQDRMHPRYRNRADVWMKSRNRAKQFGIKSTTIEIY